MGNLFVASIGYAAITASVLAIATMGFSMQFGVSNILNLAYGDLMTVAAYVEYAFIQRFHWNLWLVSALAIVITGLLTVVMNRYILQYFVKRRSGPFVVMIVTFGISTIIENIIMAIWGPNQFTVNFGGNHTVVKLGALSFSANQLIIIGLAVFIMLFIHTLLTRTGLGKAMRALVDNAQLTQACGVRTSRVIDIAWFISGCLCGAAGLVLLLSTNTGNNLIGNNFLMFVIPAAFLGGIGSIYGSMLGAVLIGFVSEWSAALIGPQYKIVIALVALLVVFLFRPEGLIAMPERKWEA